ncbi:MAG TPA: hypothetical protein VGN37_19880 [Actinocatenispora sp.]
MNHTATLAVGTISEGGIKAVGVFYIISGLICVGLAVLAYARKQGSGRTIFTGIVGLVGLIYGLYLELGDATTVFISFYIFILPILAIINGIVTLVRSNKSGTAQAGPYNAQGVTAAPYGQPAQPGQAQPYGQPAQPAQYGQPQAPAPQYGQQAQQYGQAPQYGQPTQPPAQPTQPTQPAYGQQQAPPPPPPTQTNQPLWPGNQ